MTARLRTDFWVAALRRRAESAGAYISIARRGADEAGAIFILVRRGDGAIDFYGPAPQSVFEEERPGERLFLRIAEAISDDDLQARTERELKFDSDMWLIDIEDREGRAFVDIVAEPAEARFTHR